MGSPTQRLMGRRTKTLIPTSHVLLKLATTQPETMDKRLGTLRLTATPPPPGDHPRIQLHNSGAAGWCEEGGACWPFSTGGLTNLGEC